eukprot:SAG31_NODE_2129_length_6388_cov_3.199396_5_plen_96_part_00
MTQAMLYAVSACVDRSDLPSLMTSPCRSDGNTSDDEESLPVRLAFSQPASTESSEVTTTRPNERWRHRYGVGTLQLSTIDDDEGDDGNQIPCADS